ncbi:MAG: carboxymuconolactone decarboxylase family protein [Alphaproteobacteria bacterium]|nr:carboxymuconolactone decarboxylase family protein [Alphaproteobacteria bacterium]
MARVTTIDEDERPELADLVGRIRAKRRGRLINVYRLLLHSPILAETWFAHNNAVRWNTGIDGRTREMVIIRVALLNRVDYVVKQHVPTLALAEGLTLAECDALNDWRSAEHFTPRDRAVLAYTDSMTRDIQVPDDVFAALRPFYDERGIVELTVLIGTYAMHNRVFQALEIDPEPPVTSA